MIFDWFINRKKRAIERKRNDGFSWAAGELLRGASYSETQRYMDSARTFGDYDAFYEGAEEALRMFRARCEKLTSIEQGVQHVVQLSLDMQVRYAEDDRSKPIWVDLEAQISTCGDVLDTIGSLA